MKALKTTKDNNSCSRRYHKQSHYVLT